MRRTRKTLALLGMTVKNESTFLEVEKEGSRLENSDLWDDILSRSAE